MEDVLEEMFLYFRNKVGLVLIFYFWGIEIWVWRDFLIGTVIIGFCYKED